MHKCFLFKKAAAFSAAFSVGLLPPWKPSLCPKIRSVSCNILQKAKTLAKLSVVLTENAFSVPNTVAFLLFLIYYYCCEKKGARAKKEGLSCVVKHLASSFFVIPHKAPLHLAAGAASPSVFAQKIQTKGRGASMPTAFFVFAATVLISRPLRAGQKRRHEL